MPFYYPNWNNDFWRVMGLLFFGDKDHFALPGQKRFDQGLVEAFCRQEGIALYDTACEIKRLKDNASDKFLEVVAPTDLPELLARIPACRTLVTTGQKATDVIVETFNCTEPPVGGQVALSLGGRSLTFWRMPSTSRAYPLALEKKASFYQKLWPQQP